MALRERDYRNLKVWIAAHGLAVRIYTVTKEFPESERFALVTQLRRSVASVAANLAEGAARTSDAAFANFVEVAYASASEADYELLLARDVGYLTEETHARLADDPTRFVECLPLCVVGSGSIAARALPVVPLLLSANR